MLLNRWKTAEYVYNVNIRIIDNTDSVIKSEEDALLQLLNMEINYNAENLSRIHFLDVRNITETKKEKIKCQQF